MEILLKVYDPELTALLPLEVVVDNANVPVKVVCFNIFTRFESLIVYVVDAEQGLQKFLIITFVRTLLLDVV